jgi:hypothetical protein
MCLLWFRRTGCTSGDAAAVNDSSPIQIADERFVVEAQHRRALLHGAPTATPRQTKPGEEVWRLRDSDIGRVQTCELRDNSQSGAGWEVQILEAGEILVSRQCANEREARYVAEAAMKDYLRTGSSAIEKGGA